MGEVDQQDHRQRDKAQGSGQEAEPAVLTAQRQHSERHRQRPEQHQQVEVGGAGGADAGGRSLGDLRQVGVARLADLDRAVVDELGDDEERPGGDQDHGRGPGGRDHPAGGGGDPRQQPAGPADRPLQCPDRAEAEGKQGTQQRP